MTTIEQASAVDSVHCLQLEAVAWVTMWPSPDGINNPVFHASKHRPTYGSPLDEALEIYPLCTLESAQQAVAAERAKRDYWVNAYNVERTDLLETRRKNIELEAALRQAVDALENSQTFIGAVSSGGFGMVCFGANDLALDKIQEVLHD